MRVTWNYYYGTMQKLSLLTGLWPFMSARARFLRLGLITITMVSLLIPQIAYQFTCKQDLQCTCEAMTSYLLVVAAAFKMYSFIVNTNKVKEVTRHLFTDWQLVESAEEYEIMKSYANNCRQFSLLYSIYCLTCVWIFMAISFVPKVLDIVSPLNETRPLLMPYPGHYFVDHGQYFIYIFWHATIGFEIIMAGIVATDCMFVTYVEHICNRFALLGYHFEYLFCTRNKIVEHAMTDLNYAYRKKIGFFVNMHKEALKFAQILENTFTVPFAFEMLLSTIGISITLLQMTQGSNFLKILKYFLYVVGQLLHLFFLSFEGQRLLDHSLQTRDKIYNSSWYEAPKRSQKLIIMVMMQSLQPTFFSAGKVYIFSLESFTTVLQTSMSYFTVLASFQ